MFDIVGICVASMGVSYRVSKLTSVALIGWDTFVLVYLTPVAGISGNAPTW